MTKRRTLAFAIVFIANALLGGAIGVSAAKGLSLPVPAWTAIGEEADRALRAGKWEAGRDAAERLIGEILAKPVEGEGLSTLLARAVAYRAIACAGLGDVQAAEWSAAAARELGFTLRDLDLSPFGASGEVLRAALRPEATRPNPEVRQVGPGVGRPALIERVPVAFPEAMRGQMAGGVVITQVTIGVDGRVSAPTILHSPSPYLSLAALDSLRAWRFKPSILDGKPVPVTYVLTVNFSVGGALK